MRAALLRHWTQTLPQASPIPREEELAMWRARQFWRRVAVILASAIVLMLVSLWAVVNSI